MSASRKEKGLMAAVDISTNQRIPQLMQLMESIRHLPRSARAGRSGRRRDQSRLRRSRLRSNFHTRAQGGEYQVQRLLSEVGPRSHQLSRRLGGHCPSRGGSFGGSDLHADCQAAAQCRSFARAAAGWKACTISVADCRAGGLETDVPIDWVALLHPKPTAFTEQDVEDLIMRANLVGAMASNLHQQ
jgi:hypothetical protein